MQLIVNMPLLNIQFPANAIAFYNFINNVSNFNIIPASWLAWLNNYMASFTSAMPSLSFQSMGFNTDSIISNMSSGVVYIGIFILIAGFALVLKLIKD